MPETYQERILRFRILRHDELPEAHKAEYRLNGIDPDNNWTLVWSFESRLEALRQLYADRKRAASWQTYKMVDAGEETVVERTAWF